MRLLPDKYGNNYLLFKIKSRWQMTCQILIVFYKIH
jgi:hypothetical protein